MGDKKKDLLDQTTKPESAEKILTFDEKSVWRDIQRGDFNQEIDSSEDPFIWEKVVKGCDKKIVPAFHFQHPYASLMKTFSQHLRKIVFSLRWSTYESKSTGESVGVFWPVIVHEIKGLYLRVRFFGNSAGDYWVNVLSEELQPFDGDLQKLLLFAPPHIREKMRFTEAKEHRAYLEGNMECLELMQTDQSFLQARQEILSHNKFRKGERVELLDSLYSDRVRVAEVQQVRGRRTLFKVSSEYYKYSTDERKSDEDRQHRTNRTWIDESSPLIFHVGWAALGDYNLEVIDGHPYRDHAYRVAEHIKLNRSLNYSSNDATLSKTMRDCRPNPKYKHFKVGMKLEFLDWLDDVNLNCLKIGTIAKILPNDYLLITSDEAECKEILPVHASSAYIFPPEYASQHEIPLLDPETKKKVKNFDWSDYLKRTKSQPAPVRLFHETPENLEEMFPIGSYLEASCHNESYLCFPAKVKALRGRLIEVRYLSYNEEDTELFDYRSSDLFPIGHSEGFGLTLQA